MVPSLRLENRPDGLVRGVEVARGGEQAQGIVAHEAEGLVAVAAEESTHSASGVIMVRTDRSHRLAADRTPPFLLGEPVRECFLS